MRRLTIIFCLIPSMLINTQVIDWNNFNEKTMNEVMFRIICDYTKTNAGYSLIASAEHHKIYTLIKKNHEQFLLDDLSAKINEIVPVSSVGILDSISFKDIKYYKEIANRCITDWIGSPSDAFFMLGWGKVVVATSYYNKRTKTIYISVVFKS